MLIVLPTASGYVRSEKAEEEVLSLGWAGVVRQSATNTCGPAVIATLLHWRGQVVTDQDVAAMTELRPGGVTLAEFSRLANEFDLPGRWFYTNGENSLSALPAPSVVHLKGTSGHFAIHLGTVGRYVQLADPARGRIFVPAERFRQQWTGRSFLFESGIAYSDEERWPAPL